MVQGKRGRLARAQLYLQDDGSPGASRPVLLCRSVTCCAQEWHRQGKRLALHTWALGTR